MISNFEVIAQMWLTLFPELLQFAEELRPLTVHLDMKALPAVANAGEIGSQPSFAEVLAAPLGGMKSPGAKDSASVLVSRFRWVAEQD